MNRYMKADFYRIFGRVSRYVTLVILFLAFGGFLYAVSDGATPYGMVETVTQLMNVAIAPIFGIVEYGVVYSAALIVGKPQDDLEDSGLAGAVGTDQTVDLSFFNLHIYVRQDFVLPVAFL